MTWSFCFLLVLWRLEAVSLVNISVDVSGRKKFFFLNMTCPGQSKGVSKLCTAVDKIILFRKLSNG